MRVSSYTMSLVPSFFSGRGGSVFEPFSLDMWDPFEGFGVAAVQPSGGDREATAMANARMDWKETPESHVFKVDLPGLKKEEVKVEVEDGRVLQISGERRREQEEKADKWHRVERSSGRFARRFRLPENVKLDGVRANMENGVLTVVVPKAEERKPEVKAIDIAGGEPEREREREGGV
ncbi:17.6 kDa class I heat shock protein-like [Syzygium oleosum]|uniref:17.6 kDa class I heat shock protein-like n=1 Tax=Syzygium oleosum TaxID=219896 RepID=UPI0011D1D924|nr:17.6 kDa class I heat shock protein-like [Syzygium oleosum]